MAKKGYHGQKRRPHRNSAPPPPAATRVSAIAARKEPNRYGKPFVLLEDANKDTFEFKGGQWVAHGMTIAECRENGLVSELPQKVNGMTRYEIRAIVTADE